ncbi:MAG: glucosamine-6-phosphate deaminase [Weeksellaceae bacterium]|nr:glucosamine-6-phosphate deaminase [Weeksellaceae bacterium]
MTKTINTHLPNNIHICSSAELASQKVAQQIAHEILAKQKLGQHIVLGLATGNTPKLVYHELVRMHQNEELSFKNVISFNLDEYYPMNPEHPLSYHNFMQTHLFNQVDILPGNIHIPHGSWEKQKLEQHCAEYEEKINQYGGIDVQLLGIGRNGHIGFNEPGSTLDSRTRLIDLHSTTRKDAAEDFEGLDNVPTQAITMGIQTIITAKKILLLALGKRKSEIIKKTLESSVSNEIPATYLQTRQNIEYILDEAAASLLNS